MLTYYRVSKYGRVRQQSRIPGRLVAVQRISPKSAANTLSPSEQTIVNDSI